MAVVGPTASAKTEVAMGLAERTGAEIVSVDSVQVYRGMDIGSAKPDAALQARVRHHMIDVADPQQIFTAAEFQRQARQVIARSRVPLILCGGSGLHFRAVVDPLTFPPADAAVRSALDRLSATAAQKRLLAADPQAGRWVDMANPRRVARALEVLEITGQTPSQRAQDPLREQVRAYQPLIPFRAVGLDPGPGLAGRVSARLQMMRTAGVLAEVRALANQLGPTASQAVGYRQLLGVVRGEIDEEEGFRKVQKATLALAKRQRTFFRRDPRITWLPWSDDPSQLLARAEDALEGETS